MIIPDITEDSSRPKRDLIRYRGDITLIFILITYVELINNVVEQSLK